jgi:hypothetical protein
MQTHSWPLVSFERGEMHSWLEQWFELSTSARNGGVVRRSAWDVQRMGLMSEAIKEARNRGWHIIETGDQLILLCHEGEIRLHC